MTFPAHSTKACAPADPPAEPPKGAAALVIEHLLEVGLGLQQTLPLDGHRRLPGVLERNPQVGTARLRDTRAGSTDHVSSPAQNRRRGNSPPRQAAIPED